MDNPEASLTPPRALVSPPVAAPGEDPFSQRGSGGSGGERTLRKRIAGLLAAIVALGAKFWAVIKGAVLFLPKLKVLTTAGTALISVAAYRAVWQFARAPYLWEKTEHGAGRPRRKRR